MYTIASNEITSRIESYKALWGMLIEDVQSGAPVAYDGIQNVQTDIQSTTLSDDIELGAVCSQSVTAELVDDGTKYLGNEYVFSLYTKDATSSDTNDEKIPMGHFTCVKSKKSGGSVQLTMADRLYFSDKPYVPHIPIPNWNRSVEDDICRQLGLQNGNDYTEVRLLRDKNGRRLIDKNGKVLYSKYFYFKVSSVSKDVTMRQMLSYLASAQGQFGYVDRYGKYVRKWYGKPVKTLDNNTIDLPTLSERQNAIVGIICKVSDDVTLSLGVTDTTQGRVLEFENPYMTESLLQSLWRRIGGFSWYTTELYHRLGDPRFDIGDVVTYTNEIGRAHV